MFGDDHDGPELHVPAEALRKPRGAEVGEDGKVTCIACAGRITLANADIVGQGYRCAPCSHQAEVAALQSGRENVDASAHLSRGAREHLRKQGTMMIIGGVALIVAGVAVFIATMSAGSGTKLGVFIAAGGVALAGTGAVRKSAAG